MTLSSGYLPSGIKLHRTLAHSFDLRYYKAASFQKLRISVDALGLHVGAYLLIINVTFTYNF